MIAGCVQNNGKISRQDPLKKGFKDDYWLCTK